MRLAALFLVLTMVAGAQPRLVASASVGKDVYAYGETITFRYTVRNEGTEPTAVWGSSTCKLDLTYGPLTASRSTGCVADFSPTTIEPGRALTWVWELDPSRLGLPVNDGTQTITGFVAGECGSTFETTAPCRMEASASFQAPRYLGGMVDVTYDVADEEAVEALLATYDGELVSGEGLGTTWYTTWAVSGAPLDDIVAEIDENESVEEAYAHRVLYVSQRVVPVEGAPIPALFTPPAPNPTSADSRFGLRFDRTQAVRIDVVDRLGRRVAVLHDGPLAGGVEHTFRVAEGLAPGVYAVRVVGEGVQQTRRLTVVR